MGNAFVDSALNDMLDSLAARLDEVSLHSAFSASGANEVTGGSYARQAITWNAAASGALDSSNQPSFSVPSGQTVAWIGYWSTSESPDVFMGMTTNRQSGDVGPTKYVVDTGNDTIEAPAHGFSNDDRVAFWGGTPPGGLTEGTHYWVVNATTDDFQVASSQGGSPGIDLTSQGDVDVRCAQVRIETFAADGTFNLTDADVDFLT